MLGNCLLETDGYTVNFEFLSLDKPRKRVALVTELTLKPEFGDLSLSSSVALFDIRHLQALSNYISTHIAKLRNGETEDSHVFSLLELRFNIQALGNELEAGQGMFGLRFLIHVGEKFVPPLSARSHVWVGSEAYIDVKQAQNFCRSITELLSDLTSGQ